MRLILQSDKTAIEVVLVVDEHLTVWIVNLKLVLEPKLSLHSLPKALQQVAVS